MEEKKRNIETTTLNPVPENERKTWIDVALIQAGIYICVPSLLLGGILAMSMPTAQAVIAGVLGYVVSTVLVVIVGFAGADLGVPTCVVVSSPFGKRGARYIISTIFAFAMIGWFAVQNSVCGSAFSNMLDAALGIHVPVKASIIIWGIIMLLTAVYGITGLKVLNQVAVPALILVFAIGSYLAIKNYGIEALSVDSSDHSMSIVDGIMMTTSFLAVGISCAPDFTRYQKTKKDVVLSSAIGIVPAGVILLLLGIVLTKLTGENDLSLILTNIDIPILGIVVLILATWTTNTTNAYSGGLNLVMLFNLKDDKRALATMIAGVIGTIVAVTGLTDSVSGFLDILGVLFMPVGGIIIADYWFICRGKVENWSAPGGIDWIGVLTWVAGCIGSYCIPSGYALYLGFFTSMILYGALRKFFPRKPAAEEVKENA